MNLRFVLRSLFLLASFIGIIYLVKAMNFYELLNANWIDYVTDRQDFTGYLKFLVIGALATAIGVPRQLIAFLAGFAFGFIKGMFIALAAMALGCIVTFYLARILGRGLIHRHFSKRILRLDDFVRDNPMSMTLLIRLLPVGNNFLTNLTAGLSRVPAFYFFLGSVLGYLPQAVLFALAGSGTDVDSVWRIGLSALLLVVSVILGIWLYKRFRHGKSLNHQIDYKLGVTK